MGNLSGGARFLPEALALDRIIGTGADELKSDRAVEALVLGLQDDTQASLAQLGEDAVRSNGHWESRHSTHSIYGENWDPGVSARLLWSWNGKWRKVQWQPQPPPQQA